MRIVGGTHRGRIISPPSSFNARPTTDFAKENLFNTLVNYFDFEEVRFLDLFSGTGSISYEAASRGAQYVLSVEANPAHQKFIGATAKNLSLDTIKSIRSNVFTFLKSSYCEQFDIVFADPPYDLPKLDTLPGLIIEKGLVSEGGLLIFEHSADFDFTQMEHFWQQRKYGSVNFSFFRL